jgi:hypothetical protein
MSTKKTGGPAFPLHNHGSQTLGMHLSGMTLRDYFAEKAMQGFIGHAPAGTPFGASHEDVNLGYAKASYAMADAMLKAREQ